MPMLPVPTLDHVVVNVRDDLDRGLESYRRLGFTLTPRGYHTLGSMNHLAIFGTEYLELIAAAPGEPRRSEILDAPLGLSGLVFGTEDSASVYEALLAAGVAVDPPNAFSRPVELPNGERRDAVFRTVRLKPGTTDAGRLYFCHHFTRDLVWRDEWRLHPNGTIGVIRAVIAADDPGRLAALFASMFGGNATRRQADGHALLLGLSRFDIVKPDRLASDFGSAAPDGAGRATFMAALTLRTRSLEAAASALAAGQVKMLRGPGRIVVPASEAIGVALEFRE
jgi:hypothetical protein